MKKGNLVISLVSSILILVVLLFLFVKTPNGKIVMIPFLICSIALVLKNVFSSLNNGEYVKIYTKIFNIGFLCFWYGFLFFATYKMIIEKRFELILFSIPFYIVGIYVIKSLRK